jgi:hypothetical protein
MGVLNRLHRAMPDGKGKEVLEALLGEYPNANGAAAWG